MHVKSFIKRVEVHLLLCADLPVSKKQFNIKYKLWCLLNLTESPTAANSSRYQSISDKQTHKKPTKQIHGDTMQVVSKVHLNFSQMTESPSRGGQQAGGENGRRRVNRQTSPCLSVKVQNTSNSASNISEQPQIKTHTYTLQSCRHVAARFKVNPAEDEKSI